MVIASVKATTLEGALGAIRSGWRLDAYGICFPSGVPFVQVFKDYTENVALRQLRLVYPVDPNRLAPFLGVGVVIEKLPGYGYPWQAVLTVASIPIARIVPVTVNGRAVVGSIYPLLPVSGKIV